MRVFVLVLAILLLPLRGWLGDGMGMAMAIEATQTATAAHAGHDMAGMSHDGDDAPHASPNCQSTCSDCQLCHSVAMALWPELTAVVASPRLAPAFVPAAFASAEPAPGLKPPIS